MRACRAIARRRRVGVGAEAEEDFAGVVHVHVFVHHHDVFNEHHLPHAPDTDVEVFHRRDADDGGGIDGVLPVRDGRDVKDGIPVGGKTSKRCFPSP